MSSSRKPELKLDWCSYDAAKYAVKHWHYSKSLPCSKTARIGVWENGGFVGCLVFAWGANKSLSGEYGLTMIQAVELCRIALTKHQTPVSKIITIATKMLKHAMPGLRLIISYADPEHGHIGTVYQAAGWLYVGEKAGTSAVLLNGKVRHRRTINSKHGSSSIEWLRRHVDPQAEKVPTRPKHKYLLPLDTEIRRKILPLSKPYPKRCAASDTRDTPGHQPGEPGAAPRAALQSHIELD